MLSSPQQRCQLLATAAEDLLDVAKVKSDETQLVETLETFSLEDVANGEFLSQLSVL